MLSNALRNANRQNLASRARVLAAPAVAQRSLHTPIGNTVAKDEGFEVTLHTLPPKLLLTD